MCEFNVDRCSGRARRTHRAMEAMKTPHRRGAYRDQASVLALAVFGIVLLVYALGIEPASG